jgi:hypothetical protein
MINQPDMKPSAEMQAIVMNLWNVIRETAQASTAISIENKAFAEKRRELELALTQEHERLSKLQVYAEHLQAELKARETDKESALEEYRAAQETVQEQAILIQELRRITAEQEQIITERTDERAGLLQKIALTEETLTTEQARLQTTAEALKQDLAISRRQALEAAAEVDELRAEIAEMAAERNSALEANEQIRWRLEALEKNAETERAELERKLEEARIYSGEITAELEDAKRLVAESKTRIEVLAAEREQDKSALRAAVEKAESESATWSQIAEEQAQNLSGLQAREQELLETLERLRREFAEEKAREEELSQQRKQQYSLEAENAFEERLAQAIEQERTAQREALDGKIAEVNALRAADKNMYENALETLKRQLQEERVAAQKTLDAHASEYEERLAELTQTIESARAEQKMSVATANALSAAERGDLRLGALQREELIQKIQYALDRVESALAKTA